MNIADDGGIMIPEDVGIEDEIPEINLMDQVLYVDSAEAIPARCPLSGSYCITSCALLRGETMTVFACSLSAIPTADGASVVPLYRGAHCE